MMIMGNVKQIGTQQRAVQLQHASGSTHRARNHLHHHPHRQAPRPAIRVEGIQLEVTARESHFLLHAVKVRHLHGGTSLDGLSTSRLSATRACRRRSKWRRSSHLPGIEV